MDDDEYIRSKPDKFTTFENLGLKVDASAFYPSIEGYYGSGSLPFLRVADIDSTIDYEKCTSVPVEICDMFPTLSKVYPGDILFTKGGSVARIGLVTEVAAASRDLIFINSSILDKKSQAFLYAYFQTDFFYRSLIRSSSQTAQPHLTLTLVRELAILKPDIKLIKAVYQTVSLAFSARNSHLQFEKEATKILLDELGLTSWKPKESLYTVINSKEAFSSNRLDAEHFQPKFDELIEHLNLTGGLKTLGDLLLSNQRGKQPKYSEDGLPVLNSRHVLRGSVSLNINNRNASFNENTLLIKKGDVLLNGTGVGTIGRSAPYLYEENAIPDNHVTILRPKTGLDPVYLSVFLNSIAGQLQVDKWFRGSSGQIELYPKDIAKFQVWLAPEVIQKRVREAVENSFKSKEIATQLFQAAIRAVEIAIESNDELAIKYLEEYL